MTRQLSRRRTARRRHRRSDRRRASRRGRQCLADPGDRRVAGARARQRAGLTSRCCKAASTISSPTAARELFDCAGQGRIDVFFLSGGQIDGEGNINLVEHRRLRASEGALPRLVRLGLSLLRRAEGDPVPHRAFAPHAGSEGRLHQRAGRATSRTSSAPAGRSRWSPIAACSHSRDGRFRLASVHPGHTRRRSDREHRLRFRPPREVPETPAPSPETLRLMREVVAPQARRGLSAVRAQVFGVGAAAFAR